MIFLTYPLVPGSPWGEGLAARDPAGVVGVAAPASRVLPDPDSDTNLVPDSRTPWLLGFELGSPLPAALATHPDGGQFQSLNCIFFS